MHGHETLLTGSALLVIAAFVFVTACIRLRLPTLLGYMAAGLAIGPSGLGLVTNAETLGQIGEIGVVLLLFALGLEFSFARLKELRRLIFGAGLAQVLVTTALVGGGALLALGLPLAGSVLLGGAVAMSSTALCLRLLAGKGALGTPEGRASIAVLLFQDLAAVAFILLHDASFGSSLGEGLVQLGLGAAALGCALLVSRIVLQPVAALVANSDDPEPVQLMALALALGAALGSIALGLSPALGAFAAGMIISESDARNVVEHEIRPFRDLFVGVFFISVGAQVHLNEIAALYGPVLLWLGLIVLCKPVVTAIVLRLTGEPLGTAVRSAVILGQAGEFGLVLLTLSMASGLIPHDLGSAVVLAIVLSMVISVLAIQMLFPDGGDTRAAPAGSDAATEAQG